jgi:Ca2+-binding EF-hand superfamily protein
MFFRKRSIKTTAFWTCSSSSFARTRTGEDKKNPYRSLQLLKCRWTGRTGTLDRQQLSNAIKELKGNALSRSELQEMFYTLDRNGDGTIDYLEFAQVVEIFNEGEFE